MRRIQFFFTPCQCLANGVLQPSFNWMETDFEKQPVSCIAQYIAKHAMLLHISTTEVWAYIIWFIKLHSFLFNWICHRALALNHFRFLLHHKFFTPSRCKGISKLITRISCFLFHNKNSRNSLLLLHFSMQFLWACV